MSMNVVESSRHLGTWREAFRSHASFSNTPPRFGLARPEELLVEETDFSGGQTLRWLMDRPSGLFAAAGAQRQSLEPVAKFRKRPPDRFFRGHLIRFMIASITLPSGFWLSMLIFMKGHRSGSFPSRGVSPYYGASMPGVRSVVSVGLAYGKKPRPATWEARRDSVVFLVAHTGVITTKRVFNPPASEVPIFVPAGGMSREASAEESAFG